MTTAIVLHFISDKPKTIILCPMKPNSPNSLFLLTVFPNWTSTTARLRMSKLVTLIWNPTLHKLLFPLQVYLNQRWSESLLLTSAPVPKKVTPAPAPELINLHCDSCIHCETPTPVYTLESRVDFATWGKITAWTILPLANMDEYCHACSAGKQVVVSCLCWSTVGFP